jgi:hypothetical protein
MKKLAIVPVTISVGKWFLFPRKSYVLRKLVGLSKASSYKSLRADPGYRAV